MNVIKQADTQLFLYLNSKHSAFFDVLMYWLSDKWIWLPFYAVLLVMVIYTFKKKALLLIPLIALMILLSDQSAGVVKRTVQRYRPCHNLLIQQQVHVVDSCGGQYGFVSSHAANSFAIALFLSVLFYKRYRSFPYLLFIWAALVSYSRIYNGVHYPTDVAGGAVIGMLSATITIAVYKLLLKRTNFN